MAWKETSSIAPKGPPVEAAGGATAGKVATPPAKRPASGAEAGKAIGATAARLVSLDAFRGLIMLLMASAGLHLAEIVKSGAFAESGVEPGSFYDKFVRFWAWQFDHVPWQGGVLWDMIQPAFMFMVGVALPYSFARRAEQGESYAKRFLHMLVRSAMLIVIALFLSTLVGDKQTNFVFMNVLAQIGLGYPFLFLFVNRPLWLQIAGLVLILGGSWYAYFQHPLPAADFDYVAAYDMNLDQYFEKTKPNGDPEKQKAADEQRAADKKKLLEDFVPPGMKQHWAIHSNFGTWLDQIVLNEFPRPEPFVTNRGGYATFNFVASLGTMLLGLIVGELLRSKRTDAEKMKRLGLIGLICLVLGLAAGFTVVPIVKRIWTPSWMLASGGIVVWMLAMFYWVVDIRGWKRLAWPLAVVGMNSIAVYMMAQLLKGWTGRALKTHLALPYGSFVNWLNATAGTEWNSEPFSGTFGPMYQSLAVLFCFWLVCVWMYRRKIFIRL